MGKVVKTQSEILWDFSSFKRVYQDGVIEIAVEMKNPLGNPGSLGSFQFQTPGGEWLDGTLASSQVEDMANIPLSGKSRLVVIRWDAVADLRLMNKFLNVPVVLSFYDRPGYGGVQTEVKQWIISEVDFTLQDQARVIKPVSSDAYMDFVFMNPVAIRPCKMHFKVEVDTVESFNSPNLLAFDSLEDQTGWKVNGGAFPVDGIDGNVESKIELVRNELRGLGPGDYYFRITPVVDQFWANIDVPSEGQVYVGTNVDVSGTVIIIS